LLSFNHKGKGVEERWGDILNFIKHILSQYMYSQYMYK